MPRVDLRFSWSVVPFFASALFLVACEAHCPPGTSQVQGHCVVQPSAGSGATMSVAAQEAAGAGAGSAARADGTSTAIAGPPSSAPAGSMSTANAGSPSGANAAAPSAKPNGERCTRNEDCAAGFCKNMVDGEGICCGELGDCCVTPADCPATYRRAAMCTDQMNCRGTELVAMCVANLCSSMMVQANGACDGKPGPTCGPYPDVICMSGQANICRTNCSNDGECDANAYCDGRACQPKKPIGGSCTMTKECVTSMCNNGVCCAGTECCNTVDDCKLGLDATCVDRERCVGTIRAATCESSTCRYATTRAGDDRACVGGGRSCGNFKGVPCNGMRVQSPPICPSTCSSDADCDPGFICMDLGGGPLCWPPG